jgi:hypothetical protein
MKSRRDFFARSPLSARITARAFVAVSLLVAGLGTSGCAGNTDMSQAGEGAATLQMKGIALTPEQTEALKKAHADNPNLSTEQVKDVIGAMDDTLPLNSPQSEGSASNSGICSYIYLWGDSDGNYAFDQALHAFAGGAELGNVAISTDGWFASTSNHALTAAGELQHFEGTLVETGIFAEATTMNGWMVTTETYLCFGELKAVWE